MEYSLRFNFDQMAVSYELKFITCHPEITGLTTIFNYGMAVFLDKEQRFNLQHEHD
jgi:hypothetical protein